MAATAAVTLDTQPPVVQWGATAFDRPTGVLTVPYALDEPQLLSAAVLAGVQTIPMATAGGQLTATLTGSVPTAVTVRALTRDAYGNETPRELPVLLDLTWGPARIGRIAKAVVGRIASVLSGGRIGGARKGRVR